MTAKSIFGRLERDGWAEVERWVGEHEAENLHLDFKRIASAAGTLENADLEHLAKAMSAFANVEGGVLIFGVHATGGSKRDPDVVQRAGGR